MPTSSVEWLFWVFATLTLGMVLSVAANLVSVLVIRRRTPPKKHIDVLAHESETRIRRLSNALKETVDLVIEIEKEIKTRRTLAETLEADVKTYNELVKLREPEIEAIKRILEGERKKEERRSLIKDILVEAIFFSLGAVFAFVVT